MAEKSFKVVREFTSEKVETVVMLLFLFIIASYFIPEIRAASYVALGVIVLYFVLQMVLKTGIINEVPEYMRAVVFRLGHFHRTAGPGWVLVFPILERADIVDLRAQTFELPPQDIITADEIKTKIDTIVYYQVVDPKKAVLKVKDFQATVAGYVFASLRDIASNLELNELFGEIEKVNDIVKVKMTPLVSEWGINIIDVQITDIKIPENIQAAMHMRRQAREELAAAQDQARAQKVMIEALADASKKLDEKALTYLYIREALPKIAEGKSTKIFFPVEFANLAKSLGEAGVNFEQAKSAATALYPLALKKVAQELEDKPEDEEPK